MEAGAEPLPAPQKAACALGMGVGTAQGSLESLLLPVPGALRKPLPPMLVWPSLWEGLSQCGQGHRVPSLGPCLSHAYSWAHWKGILGVAAGEGSRACSFNPGAPGGCEALAC